MKKLLLPLISFLLTSSFFGQNFTNHTTIDQEFCGSSVIVIMDRTVGGINRAPAQMGVFDAIQHVSIVDLTAMPDVGTVQTLSTNPETFQQILLLEFEQDNKQNVLDVIEQLRFTPGVYYAAPNYFRELAASRHPNDHFWGTGALWAMGNIQAPLAWGITIGSRDVRVAVIDIGFQSHNDLNANLIAGHCFFSNQPLTTANLGTTLPPAAQSVSHGNHVAGTIGAVGNNSIGVVGVNWEVSMAPLEVFAQMAGASPITTDARMIHAITWAINNNIPIVNMSLSGFGTLASVRNHIRNNFSGLVVWSAGNMGTNNIDNQIPTHGTFNIHNIIGVGALGPTNQRASYSSFGATSVAIYAPGGDAAAGGLIFSTVFNNDFGNNQGTSMAAPHVTGVAALLLSVDPTLSAAHLKYFILQGAVPITVSTPVGLQNTRRLCAFGALQALQNTVPTYGISLSQTQQHIFAPAIAGYGPRAPLSVTITNTGNQPTGELTATLSGANPEGFRLSHTSIPSFELLRTSIFTVEPNVGLAAGTYNATVTVTGDNDMSQSFNVNFTVIPAPWSVALSPEYIFDTVIVDYATQTPLNVTITNDGSQPTGELTIALSGTDASSFELSRTSVPSLASAGTTDFTVRPNTGLTIGTYTTTVTVTGENNISASLDVNFTVISETTSIIVVETGRAPSLQAHPNPFTDEIHIVNAEIGGTLYVLNINGLVVHRQRITQQNETIQLGHLPAGTYILRVGEQSIRIVKN